MPPRTFIKQLSLRKRVTSLFFRSYSETLHRINQTPLFFDFIKKHTDDVVTTDRVKLEEYCHTQFIGDFPIDYFEFGVSRGESIRRWSQLNTSPDSRFFGFDSFEGLPENWSGAPKGSYSTKGELPAIDDSRVHFVKGLFQESMPKFLMGYKAVEGHYREKNRLVLYNDCDLYSSTLFCLTQFDSVIKPGTILIFDEFGDLVHEFRAFLDYTHAYMRKYKVLVTTPDFWAIGLMFE
jgi:Methyltransferase domain